MPDYQNYHNDPILDLTDEEYPAFGGMRYKETV